MDCRGSIGHGIGALPDAGSAIGDGDSLFNRLQGGALVGGDVVERVYVRFMIAAEEAEDALARLMLD